MEQKLQILDWIVIAGYSLGMLCVGWYFSRKTTTNEEYMLGGRDMKPWAVGLSLFASLFSAISYLASPGEIIRYGPMLICGAASLPLVHVVVARFVIPVIMKQRVTSAAELLDIKLGPSLRILAAIMFLVMRLLWMSVIIYMCAEKVVVPLMGWSEGTALWVSIAMGIITMIYTSAGGLRAVVYTDVIQTFVLFGAAILSILLITKHLGGVGQWFPTSWENDWLEPKVFGLKERVTFFSGFISYFTWYVLTAASDQMAIQRYLAIRDVKGARRMYGASLISSGLVAILLALLGFALLAYFKANINLLPGQANTINECADKLFPHFILIGLPVGVTGLAIAGLLAAAMSSLSSGINSSALVISVDFIDRFTKMEFSESGKIKLAKFISLGIGIAVVLLSLIIGNIRGNLMALTSRTANLLCGPLAVPFFIALFYKRGREVATFIGTIASIVVAVLISFSSEILGIYISFVWNIPVSFVIGIGLSIILSLLCPDLCWTKKQRFS